MKTKYIYSSFKKRHATERFIKRDVHGNPQIEPVRKAGSSVSYGESIDTSEPYATADELIDDLYSTHQKGQLFEYGKQHGDAWLQDSPSDTVWSLFAHQVTRPGRHYLIEWKHISKTSQEPYTEDYSPLFDSYDKALSRIIKHMHVVQQTIPAPHVETIVDTENGRFILDVEAVKMKHTYTIIPIDVSQEVYDKADTKLDDQYYIKQANFHFR